VEERKRCIELVVEAAENGARRSKACEILGISLRTLQRWEKEPDEGDQRAGAKSEPANTLSEAEKMLVVAVATSSQFRDLSPAQIVPILADGGVYIASEATFYRILREQRLLSHRSSARPARYSRPTEHVATGPNQVWSWDITYLRSSVRGRFYYLYLVVDVFSRMIVGWAVHEEESSELAGALILEACLRYGVDPDTLVLHSDNGGPMKGATMLATLQWLEIVPSFSRPSVKDDNAFSEALFRTLKYRPEYPSAPFESLEQAQSWVKGFVQWYNFEHRHSGIKFVTPASRHHGEEESILNKRKEVYEEARKANPIRWSRGTRNWERISEVRLNPSKRSQEAGCPLRKRA
jgi:transposase InsO family protein